MRLLCEEQGPQEAILQDSVLAGWLMHDVLQGRARAYSIRGVLVGY